MITDDHFNKLVAYVKELAKQHNELERRVAKLERDAFVGEEAANFEGRDE
jgi:hypothetical protein